MTLETLRLHERNDGISSTMLRKKADARRDPDVWVDGRHCVKEGEQVTVLLEDSGFSWVRLESGVEGFVKTKYLCESFWHSCCCLGGF